jgi:hypothetical protein
LLRSDEAFQRYLAALSQVGLEHSINAAAQRRDKLLASTTVASGAASGVSSSVSAKVDSTSTTSTVGTNTSPSSRSQDIAQAVMSGKATGPSVSASSKASATTSPESAQLATALASGAGTPGNPIFVSVNDSELPFLFRIMQTNFVLVTNRQRRDISVSEIFGRSWDHTTS